MDDGELLFAAILDTPDDDTARLVYADWLQEQGEDDRAALIRLQVEVAQNPQWGCLLCHQTGLWITSDVYEGVESGACECRWGRVRSLTDKHPEWLPVCPYCSGSGFKTMTTNTGPLPCPKCGGSPVEVHCRFVRGLLVVSVPTLATVVERVVGDRDEEGDKDLKWRLTEWVKGLRKWPVAEVWVRDRRPAEMITGKWGLGWEWITGWTDQHSTSLSPYLPPLLFDRLVGGDEYRMGDVPTRYRRYDTAEEAQLRLAQAVAKAVRG